MKKFIAIAAAILFSLPAFAQDNKPTIFVAPLDGDIAQIQGWQPALGEGLAEMLITELTKLKKFDVLESTALEHLKDEIRLGEDGFVGEDEKVEKGGFAGADFMFRGKVTRFGSKSNDINLGGFAPRGLGALGIKTSNTDVRIDWRIVDAYTRKIVASGEAVASENGMGFNIGVAVGGAGGMIGFNNKEFMNSALGKATVKAIGSIMVDVTKLDVPESGRHKAKTSKEGKQTAAAQTAQEALRSTPGKVLATPAKGVLIVSLGSKHGFKNGDKLNLYQTVDTKDDSGAVVFTEEKLVGEVTLEAVQEDKSKATYSGDAAVKAGWVVKAK